jgi:hypothetical protein
VLHSKRGDDDTDAVAMVHTSQHLFLAKIAALFFDSPGAPGLLVAAGCCVIFEPSLYHDLACFRITQAWTNR